MVAKPRRDAKVIPILTAEDLNIHEKQTVAVPIIEHQKPRNEVAEMATAAGFDEDEDFEQMTALEQVTAQEVVEVGPDLRAAAELQKKILDTVIDTIARSRQDKKKPHDALSAKQERLLRQYFPNFFATLPNMMLDRHATPTDNPAPKPNSPANRKAVIDLLNTAGFDKKTTLQVLVHDLPSKQAEVDFEIERRYRNSGRSKEAGSNQLVRQQEALEVLQTMFNLKKPETPKMKHPSKEAAKELMYKHELAEQAERDKQLKPVVIKKIRDEISSFAEVFKEKFESSTVAKKLAEQRSRETEVGMDDLPPLPSRLERFTDLFTKNAAERAYAKEVRARLEQKHRERQERRLLNEKVGPTFTAEGFIQSAGLADLLVDKTVTIEELRDKIDLQLTKNKNRLARDYAKDLAKRKPAETLTQLINADFDDQELKRLLANTDLLEKLIEIIEKRNDPSEKEQDIQQRKGRLSNATIQLQRSFSGSMPRIAA